MKGGGELVIQDIVALSVRLLILLMNYSYTSGGALFPAKTSQLSAREVPDYFFTGAPILIVVIANSTTLL